MSENVKVKHLFGASETLEKASALFADRLKLAVALLENAKRVQVATQHCVDKMRDNANIVAFEKAVDALNQKGLTAAEHADELRAILREHDQGAQEKVQLLEQDILFEPFVIPLSLLPDIEQPNEEERALAHKLISVLVAFRIVDKGA